MIFTSRHNYGKIKMFNVNGEIIVAPPLKISPLPLHFVQNPALQSVC